MKFVFVLLAAVMVAAALALLLFPLLRRRHEGPSRGVFLVALIVALILPIGTGGLYLLVGTPAALNGVAKAAPQIDIQQAITQLRTHLAQQPNDVQGWSVLAQAMTAMKQPTEARDAWDHALKADPNDVAAMVGYAETDSMARADHLIEGRSLDLLTRAIELQPDSQRALWLMGVSQFQHAKYAEAAATWRTLQPLLEAGSSVAKSVAEQIANADARAGIKPAATAAKTTGAALTVDVSLAPALKTKLKPGDQLFVFARPTSGPTMPLAVVKLEADKLPLTARLTDAMAMTSDLKLSSVPRVVVEARISHDGQPTAQPGDLEGSAGIIDTDRTTAIPLVINKVL